MSEYIGSRISLISRSDIKYVGTLQSIDSETATVSLKDVQCHGTEGRKGNPEEEIPGNDNVYDGIVFRGSDVKDLTILAPPKENRPPQMPNDPAILGSGDAMPPQQGSIPQPPQQQQQNQFRGPQPPYQQQQQFGYPGQPPNHFQQQPRFPGPGGPHGFPGQPGAVPGWGPGYGPPPPGYGGMGMGYGPPGQGFGGPPGPFLPQQQPIGPPGQQMNQQRPPAQIAGQPQQPAQATIGNKQATPQPGSKQALQTSVPEQPSDPAEISGSPALPATGPPPPIESKPPPSAAIGASGATQIQPTAATASAGKPPQKASNPRVAVPLPVVGPAPGKPQAKPAAPTTTQQPQMSALQQHQTGSNATEAATAAVAAAMAKLGATNQQAGGVEHLTQKVNQLRVQDGQVRGRGRGRGGAPARGGRRESQQKNIGVPKEDFDFESANAKFNKQDLVKEAFASGSPITSPANGAVEDPIASVTNGHTDGADDVVIPPKPSEKGYDKKSSFFDNISSDLRDRVEQQQQGEFVDGRAMRREERTKNMETFGQGSVDSGFRGRGRGRGRGGGRGYYGGRGGYDHNRGTYSRGRGRGSSEAAAI